MNLAISERVEKVFEKHGLKATEHKNLIIDLVGGIAYMIKYQNNEIEELKSRLIKTTESMIASEVSYRKQIDMLKFQLAEKAKPIIINQSKKQMFAAGVTFGRLTKE